MKLGEVIELIFKILPLTIDLDTNDKFVANDTVWGEEGYFMNSENDLVVKILDTETIQIYYADEDGEEEGVYFLGEEEKEDGIIEGDEFLRIDELDEQKIIVLFSKRFGWIDEFDSFKKGNNVKIV